MISGQLSAPHDCTPDRSGLWARVLARVLAPSLDLQLATGRPARSSNTLVIRAQKITSPDGRLGLARGWIKVMDSAGRRPAPPTPRAPLCRDRIAAAEWDVRGMIAVLASGRPIAARGAAMASGLLTDGTGPLYNRRSAVDLAFVVREATRQMQDGAESYR
jgi:hypothetical protein